MPNCPAVVFATHWFTKSRVFGSQKTKGKRALEPAQASRLRRRSGTGLSNVETSRYLGCQVKCPCQKGTHELLKVHAIPNLCNYNFFSKKKKKKGKCGALELYMISGASL